LLFLRMRKPARRMSDIRAQGYNFYSSGTWLK
jgi:hypothetical protein